MGVQITKDIQLVPILEQVCRKIEGNKDDRSSSQNNNHLR